MVGSALHLRKTHHSSKKRPPRWRSAERLHVDMLGHNGGPPLDTASSWNSFCWRKAVKKARRSPAHEVLTIRRRRAQALGLDYATFAAIFADSGTTPVTLIFVVTSDWVRHGPFGPTVTETGVLALEGGAGDRLSALSDPAVIVVALGGVDGIAGETIARAIPATAVAAGWRLDAHGAAPAGNAGEAAVWLAGLLKTAGLSPRTALLVGSERAHREIATRARLAGLLSADRYFAVRSAPKPL